MKIHCAHNALVDPATLKPNPANPNRHSAHQIQLLASIIQDQGWRGPITVSKRSGLIVRGHGRLEAALLMGAENRHGALLTIADCFRPALARLAKLACHGLVWTDCEALERRHNLGRGTLVVLDVVPESGAPTYEQRRVMLESVLSCDPVFSGDTARSVPCEAVVLTPARHVDHAEALAFYQRLRAANRALGCDFFEGVVMKRADSSYPVQLRSATEEFRGWVKHRFLT